MGAFVDGFDDDLVDYYPVVGMPYLPFTNAADLMEKLKLLPHVDGQTVDVEGITDVSGASFAISTGGQPVLLTYNHLRDLLGQGLRLVVSPPVRCRVLPSVKPAKVAIRGGEVMAKMSLIKGLMAQGVTLVEFLEPIRPPTLPLADLLSLNVTQLHLTTRAVNTLASLNITTGRELVLTPEKELLRQPNFGRRSLREVQHALGRYGAFLGMTEQMLEGA